VRNDGDIRPDDPAGTRPKVDPESLHAPQPPADLPWAEREDRAESGLENAIERLEEVHVELEPGESQHIGRFQFLLGGLIAVGVIALAAIVIVIVAGRTDQPDTTWSAWHPSGDDPLQQIADHVGATYRLDEGDQLATVTGGPLEVGTDSKVPARVVAGNQVLGGKTALFTLCGDGKSCSITGKPTNERGLLVRREALELALYAMHYTDADQVVVMIPPPAELPTFDRAVFLRRSDLENLLDQPLRDTLPAPTPKPKSVTTSPRISLVDHLTDIYGFQLAEAGDLSVYLQLGSVIEAEAAAKQAMAASGLTSAGGTTATPQSATTPQTAITPQKQPQAQAQHKPKGKSGKSGG
jgi:hypothetical protein